MHLRSARSQRRHGCSCGYNVLGQWNYLHSCGVCFVSAVFGHMLRLWSRLRARIDYDRLGVRPTRPLRFDPELLKLFTRNVGERLVLLGGGLLHDSPALAELLAATPQRRLGIDVLLAGNVHDGEQHVAELLERPLGTRLLRGELRALLIDLGPDVGRGFPVKAAVGSFLRDSSAPA